MTSLRVGGSEIEGTSALRSSNSCCGKAIRFAPSFGAAERAHVLPEGVEQVAGDLTSEDAVTRAMAGCDGVFHLAASVGGTIEATRAFNTGKLGPVTTQEANARAIGFTPRGIAKGLDITIPWLKEQISR